MHLTIRRAARGLCATACLTAAQVVNDPPINPIPFLQTDLADFGALGQMPLRLSPDSYTLGLRAADIRPGGPHQAEVTLTQGTGLETITHLRPSGQKLVIQEKAWCRACPVIGWV